MSASVFAYIFAFLALVQGLIGVVFDRPLLMLNGLILAVVASVYAILAANEHRP